MEENFQASDKILSNNPSGILSTREGIAVRD